jgi:hypothetical protein
MVCARIRQPSCTYGQNTVGLVHLRPALSSRKSRHSLLRFVSVHESVEGAYRELDAMADRLQCHGLAGDVLDLLVVDEQSQEVRRPGLH